MDNATLYICHERVVVMQKKLFSINVYQKPKRKWDIYVQGIQKGIFHQFMMYMYECIKEIKKEKKVKV